MHTDRPVIIFGNHVRLQFPAVIRPKVISFYCDLLGCKILESSEKLDVFQFPNMIIGIYYTKTLPESIGEEDYLKAAWLEIKTGDEEVLKAKLLEFGVKPLTDRDDTHFYFQGPGGQVFRLASINS